MLFRSEFLLERLMYNLNRLISELGYINIDMKEDNLILNVDNNTNTINDLLFIDTDPTYFKQIINHSNKSRKNNLIKKYVPFISLLQLLLIYTQTNTIFSIRDDLIQFKNNLNSHGGGLMHSKPSNNNILNNPYFYFIIDFVKGYINDNECSAGIRPKISMYKIVRTKYDHETKLKPIDTIIYEFDLLNRTVNFNGIQKNLDEIGRAHV